MSGERHDVYIWHLLRVLTYQKMRDRGPTSGLDIPEMWFGGGKRQLSAMLCSRLSKILKEFDTTPTEQEFELVLHELLFQLGCKLETQADIDTTEKTPDYLTSLLW